MFHHILLVLGLTGFETVSSADNAIVNAHVLRTMSARGRRLFWWVVVPFAVFVMRGVLPFTAAHIAESGTEILLIGGGIFLVLLYLHWLFKEEKDPYFVPDRLVKPHHEVWFYAFAAVLLVGAMYFAVSEPRAMLAAATGSAVFYILHGFRETAEKKEKELARTGGSDLSKILFLAVLDASFSIDGVLGAFAFTKNPWFIFWGNGIGAVVVAALTLKGIEWVGRYKWLKNGAMTSIGFLGTSMMLEGYGVHLPEWLTPMVTVSLIAMTFWSSHRHLQKVG